MDLGGCPGRLLRYYEDYDEVGGLDHYASHKIELIRIIVILHIV